MAKKEKRGIKIIKKTGKVFAWAFGILLLLGIGAFFALKSPAFQTWLAKRAAGYFSDELKTKVTIRAVDIEFFKTVNLEGIYIEDRHGDTLLYAEKLHADIHRFDFDNHYISVNLVSLSDSKIKLKKYRGEHGLSYRFIQDYFKSADTTKVRSNAPWKVDLGGIALDNITFAYIDTRDTVNDPGMDYENIRVTDVSASVSDIEMAGDSVSLKIKGLKGNERCGLSLQDFSTRLTVSDSAASLDNLHFNTKGSAVDGFISFRFNSTDDIADDFIHLVPMKGHISNSVIEMGEVAYFAPELLGMHKKVLFTGDISGKVDRLRCKNVDLRFGEVSHIAGNFSFDGLPKIEETDMNFKIREAITNKKDLEGIPSYPFNKGEHLEVNQNIGKLGNMVFSGSFEGFLNDFVAHGNLNTALGSLKLDNVAMTRESDTAEYAYVGEVHANHFNIGDFYSIPDLTFVSGDVNVDGVGLANAAIRALLDGSFSELVYRGYSYTGITVSNGKLRRQVFDGDFKVNDPNLKMNFHGIVDNSNPTVPKFVFDAKIDSANLGELGFLDKSHEYLLSTSLHMNFTGNDIDDLDGQIVVSNLLYKKDGEKFSFNEFSLNAGNSGGQRTIFLESDIVRATLIGKYQLMELPHAISDMLSNYLPTYFPQDNFAESQKDPIQEFSWFINFQNNTKPIQAIVPGLVIAPNTSFSGKFDGNKKTFNANFSSPSITYKDISYNGIQLTSGSSNIPGSAKLTGTLDELKISDTLGTKNMTINCVAHNDYLLTNLTWDNKSQKLNDADIRGLVHFEGRKSLQINFDSTQLHLNDSLWTVSTQSYMRIDSNVISFHELVFHSGDASIGLNGLVSKNPMDQVNVSMKNFNIAYLNYFTVPKGVTLAGMISSETALSNLYETPIFTSNSNFKAFYVNGQKLGDGELDAVWEKNKQAVYLHGNFSRGIPDPNTGNPIDNILFDGNYYPKNEENSLDVNAHFINIPLDVFTPIMKDYCSLINGQFGGDLHITGTPGKPLLKGTMDVFPRRIKIDYLGLAISGPQQKVEIDNNSISFDDFKVTDGYNDTATIYGHLFHENFSKFQFDMDFSFDHFMVLNTNANQNELYYGRVFATGYMNVFGYVDDIIRIDMSAKTEKVIRGGQIIYSEFNIPMTSTNEVGSTSDFITFEDHTKPVVIQKGKQLKNNGIELHLNVEATDDCIVKVIFDKTVGDELTAYGNGNLKMDITPSGDFTIFGRYEVEKGNYLFTMKNVILVPFELAKGGVISWNGDPYVAQIDADAVYKLNTSVEPFFPGDSTNPAYHRSYPVEVAMHLNDNLMNPMVSFDINLPTADQNIQETVRSYTQTDLEKNRQVLSLMVLNSFMTPSELREGASAYSNVAGGTSATLLSNFVSGTMNNWLSQISTDFNMGVKYRPNDDLTTQELKVYLQTQLLNDRMTIDVAGGKVNANQATTTIGTNGQWVGDLNVEYKLTDDGKVRLRAFNRSNDNTISVANSAYTQGVGVFYREEFETGAQLRKRYKGYFSSKKKKAQEEEKNKTTPKDSASTK
jgi:hypothetical protein